MMNSFALFRLPYEKRCTLVVQTTGEPKEFLSCDELTGQQGLPTGIWKWEHGKS